MSNQKIAIVGAGVIGASWAALFLSKGYNVTAYAFSDKDKTYVTSYVQSVWPELEKLGLSENASIENLSFETDLVKTVERAIFVQESSPERMDIKQSQFEQMDAVLPADVIIASSSSGLTMSNIQLNCKRFPERCVIGHPFNPPHLVPLVEIVGGQKTSKENLDKAQQFYDRLGKRSIRLNKEIPGHVANRIAAALWKEVLYLFSQDVMSITDLDRAVSWGPGLRWGIMGQTILYHLGGGEKGIEHIYEQFGDWFNNLWGQLGDIKLTPELEQKITAGVIDEIGNETIDELSKQRDEVLIQYINIRKGMTGIISK